MQYLSSVHSIWSGSYYPKNVIVVLRTLYHSWFFGPRSGLSRRQETAMILLFITFRQGCRVTVEIREIPIKNGEGILIRTTAEVVYKGKYYFNDPLGHHQNSATSVSEIWSRTVIEQVVSLQKDELRSRNHLQSSSCDEICQKIESWGASQLAETKKEIRIQVAVHYLARIEPGSVTENDFCAEELSL